MRICHQCWPLELVDPEVPGQLQVALIGELVDELRGNRRPRDAGSGQVRALSGPDATSVLAKDPAGCSPSAVAALLAAWTSVILGVASVATFSAPPTALLAIRNRPPSEAIATLTIPLKTSMSWTRCWK